MRTDEANRADRRKRYATLRIFRLGEETGRDVSEGTTVTERLAMLEALTAEAWALSRLPAPEVARAELPIALRRLGSEAAGDEG